MMGSFDSEGRNVGAGSAARALIGRLEIRIDRTRRI